MANYSLNFKQYIFAISNEQEDIYKALLEFDFLMVYYEEKGDSCCCEHPIKSVYIIFHKQTGELVNVGSVCIKKYNKEFNNELYNKFLRLEMKHNKIKEMIDIVNKNKIIKFEKLYKKYTEKVEKLFIDSSYEVNINKYNQKFEDYIKDTNLIFNSYITKKEEFYYDIDY
jgi:hypothetical protein